jgi:hypothetical protein
MTELMHVAAQVTLAAVAAFSILLVLVHVFKPEIDPSWRMISEYEIGHHDWIMQLAFVCWSASVFGAAVFATDPITTPPDDLVIPQLRSDGVHPTPLPARAFPNNSDNAIPNPSAIDCAPQRDPQSIPMRTTRWPFSSTTIRSSTNDTRRGRLPPEVLDILEQWNNRASKLLFAPAAYLAPTNDRHGGHPNIH